MNLPFTLLFHLASTFALPQNGTFVEKVLFKNMHSRIINGQRAAEGQFPWQVLVFANFDGYVAICGGTLISNEWVLTASHCIYESSSFTIFLGSTTFNQGTRVDSTEGHQHEGYNPDATGLNNDVAVVRLSRYVEFNDQIKAIGLQDSPIGGGVDVTVSGWGTTSDDPNIGVSNDLNYVNLRTIALDDCRAVYGDLYDGFVCTESGDNPHTGTCSGDSGGPLVSNFGSNPVHVGIVCFGAADACEGGYPSGFTQTGFFRNWIRDRTGI